MKTTSDIAKDIYEEIHPETKFGISQAKGMNKSIGNNVNAETAPTFVQDSSNKTGVSKRVIQEEIQLANNLTEEAKSTIKEKYITQTNAAI